MPRVDSGAELIYALEQQVNFRLVKSNLTKYPLRHNGRRACLPIVEKSLRTAIGYVICQPT